MNLRPDSCFYRSVLARLNLEVDSSLIFFFNESFTILEYLDGSYFRVNIKGMADVVARLMGSITEDSLSSGGADLERSDLSMKVSSEKLIDFLGDG
jgi:hypothetical protein